MKDETNFLRLEVHFGEKGLEMVMDSDLDPMEVIGVLDVVKAGLVKELVAKMEKVWL